MAEVEAEVDVRVENHGTIIMFYPETDEAKSWVRENVEIESWAWFGGGFACEPGLADGLPPWNGR